LLTAVPESVSLTNITAEEVICKCNCIYESLRLREKLQRESLPEFLLAQDCQENAEDRRIQSLHHVQQEVDVIIDQTAIVKAIFRGISDSCRASPAAV
jgi:hypothetical protein